MLSAVDHASARWGGRVITEPCASDGNTRRIQTHEGKMAKDVNVQV